MKMLRLLAFLAILIAPGFSRAATTSTPPGCPIGGATCSIPVYPFGSPYPINKLVTGSDGNIYQSQVTANVGDPASSTECGVNWKPVFIWFSKTIAGGNSIAVPTKCPTVGNAVSFLSLASIFANSQIHPITGTYNFGTTPINLNHPFGAMIDIIGDQATPANVTFNFSGVAGTVPIPAGQWNQSLFTVSGGHSFGQIDGFTFQGPGCLPSAPLCASTNFYNSGLLGVEGSGSTAKLGPNVIEHDGYFAVNARFGGYAVADGVQATGGGDGMFWAYAGVVSALGTKATGAVSGVNAAAGYLSDQLGYITMDGSCAAGDASGLALYNGGAARINGTPLGGAKFAAGCGGASNTVADITYNNTPYTNVEGNPGSTPTVKYNAVNYPTGGSVADSGNSELIAVGNGSYAGISIEGDGNTSNTLLRMNKNGQAQFGTLTANVSGLGLNTAKMFAINTNLPTNAPLCGGSNSTLSFCSQTDGKWALFYDEKLYGATSGIITIHPQAAAGTFEWDLPTTAGTSGYFLTSAGGAGAAMTWTAPPTAGSGAVQSITYQPGLLTAVNATIGVFNTFVKASTVNNIVGSAVTFSCVANPTITLYECGTSSTCAAPTTIGTVTVTAAGQRFTGTVSSAAIAAGDSIGWAITAGTCASIDIAANAQVTAN